MVVLSASGKTFSDGKSVWNNTVEKASEITHFSGVDNKGLRGIIFSKGDVNFDKYSGMSLIGYQHGSSDPTQIMGEMSLSNHLIQKQLYH